jgi:hypothetical protein
VRFLQQVDEAVMVAAFLRAEINSSKFGPLIQQERSNRGLRDARLILAPDVTNRQDIAHRASILSAYRGFDRNQALFLGFPDTIQWDRVEIEPDDDDGVRLANSPDWVQVAAVESHRSPPTVSASEKFLRPKRSL